MTGILDDGTVACTGCGEVHAEASGLLAQLREDMDGLERELRIKRAKIKRLQGEQDHALRASPHYPDAVAVLEHWKARCAPSAKELSSGKRVELVIARLRGKHSRQELELAVDGFARFPFVVDGRRSPVGSASQRFVDAELIFRDDKHVRQGIEMASRDFRTVRLPRDVLARTPWQEVRAANRALIVGFLEKRFSSLLRDDNYLLSPCPRCDDGRALITPLRIFPLGGSTLAECSFCGLTDTQLLGMVAGDQSTRVRSEDRQKTEPIQMTLGEAA